MSRLTPPIEDLVEKLADDPDDTPPEGLELVLSPRQVLEAEGIEVPQVIPTCPRPAPPVERRSLFTEPQLRRAREQAAEGRADRFIATYAGLRKIANRRGIPLHEAFAIALQGSRDKPKRLGIGARGLRQEGR